jgi:GAF domain-containing protein
MYDPRVVDAFVAMIPTLREEDRTVETYLSTSPVPAVTAPHGDAAVLAAAWSAGQEELVAAVLRESLEPILPSAEACFFAQAGNGDALRATSWTPRVEPMVRDQQIAHGEGLVGWVAAHRHTIINSHADLDFHDAARALSLGACTAVPVFAFGTLVGVLAAYLPAGERFTADDVKRLGIVAQDIGTALLPQEDSRIFVRRSRLTVA